MTTNLRGRATEADVRFGKMVKAVLDLLGMEQKYLAALVGLSTAGLNGKIKGRSPWSLGEMDQVARALGVPRQLLERDPDAVIAELSDQFANYRSA